MGENDPKVSRMTYFYHFIGCDLHGYTMIAALVLFVGVALEIFLFSE